jgi:zinc transporter ZupT
VSELFLSLLFAAAAAAANVLGGLVVVVRREPWQPRALRAFVALGAGFMLAAAILRMGPEAAALTDSAPLLILGGYLFVHLVEHTLVPHFHFGEETHPELVSGGHAWGFALLGLILHSLFDGVSIGAGFLVSPALGVLVFSAIILHKAPEGFTVASLMIASGASRRAALAASASVGFASVLGVLMVAAVSGFAGPALAISTGVTLYVAASDLIPEVNAEEETLMAWLVFAGVVLFVAGELVLELLGF